MTTKLKRKVQEYELLRDKNGKGYLDDHPGLLVLNLATALSKEEALSVLALIRELAK